MGEGEKKNTDGMTTRWIIKYLNSTLSPRPHPPSSSPSLETYARLPPLKDTLPGGDERFFKWRWHFGMPLTDGVN
jgi:hypothetical protein